MLKTYTWNDNLKFCKHAISFKLPHIFLNPSTVTQMYLSEFIINTSTSYPLISKSKLLSPERDPKPLLIQSSDWSFIICPLYLL